MKKKKMKKNIFFFKNSSKSFEKKKNPMGQKKTPMRQTDLRGLGNYTFAITTHYVFVNRGDSIDVWVDSEDSRLVAFNHYYLLRVGVCENV